MPRTSDRLVLLDTHAWVWLVTGSSELAPAARDRINRALAAGLLRIAAITLWEVALLASRGRILLGKPTALWFAQALAEPTPAIEPLTADIAVETYALPRPFHADPADRMIVATARVADALLLTRDGPILDYARRGHLAAIAV